MLLCLNIFKNNFGDFPPFCFAALPSPKVLKHKLFIQHIRMTSYRSVLREVASLLLSGSGSAVLPYPIRFPQQSKL